MDDALNPPRRRTRRRWLLAAALTRDPGESFDGLNVLKENEGDFGVVLWQAVRDVDLWSASEARAALFSPGAGARRRQLLSAAAVPDELHAAMGVLTGLVAFPGEANADALCLAAGRVARWAEGRGALATAAAFAQAASMVLPTAAHAALEPGRIAALRGDPARAETWLRRTIGLARRAGDWSSFASAYTELGSLYVGEGDEGRGRHAYIRAFRAACRASIYPARGRALVGLGRLEHRAGRYAEAERLLRLSLKPLGKDHPLRPSVAYDLAELAARQGRHEEATRALRRLLISADRAVDRLRTQALLALCASEAGDLAGLAEWWALAWPLSEQIKAGETKTIALLDLARAAMHAGNRAWAHMAATTAILTAREIGASMHETEAARLRDAVMGGNAEPH